MAWHVRLHLNREYKEVLSGHRNHAINYQHDLVNHFNIEFVTTYLHVIVEHALL